MFYTNFFLVSDSFGIVVQSFQWEARDSAQAWACISLCEWFIARPELNISFVESEIKNENVNVIS